MFQPPCNYGNTCQSMGLLGTYPYCYAKPYLLLNTTLAGNVSAVRVSFARAVIKCTVTSAQLSSVLNYNSQYLAHVSMQQTQILEALRGQFMEGYNYANSGVFAGQVSSAQTWASSIGFDPNVAAGLVNSSMPASTQLVGSPTLEQLIMKLPNTAAMDNLVSWNYTVASSVTVEPGGFCHLVNNNPTDYTDIGEFHGGLGGFLLSIAPYTGPAAPCVAAVGGADVAYGFVMWAVGKYCK